MIAIHTIVIIIQEMCSAKRAFELFRLRNGRLVITVDWIYLKYMLCFCVKTHDDFKLKSKWLPFEP